MSFSANPQNAPQDCVATDLSAVLKAAGDPLRLDILRLLARDSYGVTELSSIFATRQSGMSHHLKVLATADLVTPRREGNSIYYRRVLPDPEDSFHDLLKTLFTTIDRQPLSTETRRALEQVQRQRARACQAFFSDNADKFRAQQDLIASYPVYADAVIEMLDKSPLISNACALEIGPGEGEFLLELAPRFECVVAVDTSAELLGRAAKRTSEARLANIRLAHGDSSVAVGEGLRADCAVINMVLHHVASPAGIFEHLGQLLNPGGIALVTDLCRHDQQWVTQACGDLWMGFEPDELTAWAGHAGLDEGASQYIALRNGFQIQIRQFFRPAGPNQIHQGVTS